jgi:monofunctional biosynthetic peptidoglycan transglycosylase
MFSGIRRLTGRVLGTLSRFGNGLRWTLRIVLLLLIVDFFYLAVTWPDWKKLAAGPVPKSAFMFDYERGRTEHKDWPALRWQPVPFAAIPKTLARAVILAEDSRFYEHSGFDLIAFKEAMQYNLGKGRFALGASTISQQTVKNLFLTRSRDPLRKWHELVLTWGMERQLRKARILEIYLNVAEFGQGVYGVEAAARHYFGVSAASLTPRQAVELIATLPSPVKNNPATRTPFFERRAERILSLLHRFPGDAAAALVGVEPPPVDNGLPLFDERPPE